MTLLPCPFCGAKAYMRHVPDPDGVKEHWIECSICCARSGGKYANEECPQLYAEVRDEWNTRPDPYEATPERVESAARAIVETFAKGEWAACTPEDRAQARVMAIAMLAALASLPEPVNEKET